MQNYNSSITRGLGGMFVFAALQMLEYNDYWLAVVLAITGLANLSKLPWCNKWSSFIILGINAALSAILFYQLILSDTQYLQWIWLILLGFYVYRLRELGKAPDKMDSVTQEREVQEV